MVEVLISLLVMMIGVVALVFMQAQGWRLSGMSDSLGRASGILHEELTSKAAMIMNPCNKVPTKTFTKVVFISGNPVAQAGDASYTVQTTIAPIEPKIWRLSIKVTWPGNNTGISQSTMASRQERFRFPAGCVDDSHSPSFN